jgi:hypothetical protein
VKQTPQRIILAVIFLIAVIVAYYLLIDVGGILWIQVTCGIMILVALTFMIPYTSKEEDSKG